MLQLREALRGWLRDQADPRDLLSTSAEVRALWSGLKRRSGARGKLPASVDWREYFGPVAAQQGLADGTAHACAALAQYFIRRSTGELWEGSTRFLYYATRRLEQTPGDGGATLRGTLKAMLRCGLPPERLWPADAEQFDACPDGLLYRFTGELAGVRYVRLAGADVPGAAVLERLRGFLAAGFACVLGCALPAEVRGGEIAFPTRGGRIAGGQALVAAGYDDARRIRSTKGALLVRNAWGPHWGEAGFGWLPYRFVEEGLAGDFWTLVHPDWLASGEFTQPR
jgi:C1A family cysteine protease